MKAVVITRQGSPVSLNVEFTQEWPEPDLLPGTALIRTEASALNHLDLWVGRGLPGVELTYPRISGSDGCGIVEAVGEGVDASWVGRRVLLNAAVVQPEKPVPGLRPTAPDILMIGEHTDGALREKFVAPVGQLHPLPDDADPVEAAAFGLTFLTAWRCLVTRAGLRPGAIVLITGIGGGVANAGLQICRHFGCTTIVTSRHQWKLTEAIEFGADHTILDTGQDWSRDVRKLTGKRGVDIVLDSVGRAIHENCIKSLCRGGTFVTPGCTTGPAAVTDLARLFWLQLNILGSTMGSGAEFEEVLALFRSGALRPTLDKIFTPEQGPDAFARLEAGEQMGKIVIRW